MATINPYAAGSDVITFPAKTPAGVINAYYAAILRNQQLAAAAKSTSRWDPWVETLENFQKQVLNPYINLWLKEPFEDYRKTYDTNELIRQEMEKQTGLVGSAKQTAADKFAQQQIEDEAYGQSLGGFLNQMQPQTTPGDTGPTEPYGAYEDPWVTPPGPTFPSYNPYKGAVAPEAVSVAPTVPPEVAQAAAVPAAGTDAYYEADPGFGPPARITEPMGPPAPGGPDPGRFPPNQYAGATAMNNATAERYLSSGTAWDPVGTQRVPTGGPGEDPSVYSAGPPPMPEEALFPQGAAPPPAPAPVAAPVAAVPPRDVGVIPPATGQRSRFMGNPVTTTPTLADALRTLAGIDPLQAGTIGQALTKNQNLAGVLDPLRQNLTEAKVLELLARANLTGAKTKSEDEFRDPRRLGIEAGTDLKTQQANALRMKNEMIASATKDYLEDKTIGAEEFKIRMAAAHGKFGGAGAAAQTDTKTFLVAYTTVKLDPKNAGKTEFELRELAQQWLEDRAEDIESRKAEGKAKGEFVAGVQRPPAEQVARHTGYQQAADQLGEIGALLPKVRLEKITGGMATWLNGVRQRGATRQWGLLPPIEVPAGMFETLTKDEQAFLALTKDYADRVLRLRSGAQINDQEMERMLDFLPTDSVLPEVFKTRFSMAFDDLDRWMMSFYRASKDYGDIVPQESLRNQIVRNALKRENKFYDARTVQQFLSLPENQAWATEQMQKYAPRGGWPK